MSLALVDNQNTPQPSDPLAHSASKVIEAMLSLRDAYRTLETHAQTDDLKRFSLTEQANFFTDKSILLRMLRAEGLQIAEKI